MFEKKLVKSKREINMALMVRIGNYCPAFYCINLEPSNNNVKRVNRNSTRRVKLIKKVNELKTQHNTSLTASNFLILKITKLGRNRSSFFTLHEILSALYENSFGIVFSKEKSIAFCECILCLIIRIFSEFIQISTNTTYQIYC